MKLLYGLTEEQMKEIHLVVERHLRKADIKSAIAEFEMQKYHFTDLEIESAIDYTLDYASNNFCYVDIAQEALDTILEGRTDEEMETGKEQ